ncbi:verprolin-like [Portunus trituberculatus]|uniref:verprolin-like n=1 Tax=Portunus trituberculatus TaxID=210409 RepID=UPI001E1CDD07|nr:verprolin-like [Portunus trituberculatus]
MFTIDNILSRPATRPANPAAAVTLPGTRYSTPFRAPPPPPPPSPPPSSPLLRTRPAPPEFSRQPPTIPLSSVLSSTSRVSGPQHQDDLLTASPAREGLAIPGTSSSLLVESTGIPFSLDHSLAEVVDSSPLAVPDSSLVSLHSPPYSASLYQPSDPSGYTSCSQLRLQSNPDACGALSADPRNACEFPADCNKDKIFKAIPRWIPFPSASDDLLSGCQDLPGAVVPDIRDCKSDSVFVRSRYGRMSIALPLSTSHSAGLRSDPHLHVLKDSSGHPDTSFVPYQTVCARSFYSPCCHGHKELPPVVTTSLTRPSDTFPTNVTSGSGLLLHPVLASARDAATSRFVPPPVLPPHQHGPSLVPALSQHLRRLAAPYYYSGTDTLDNCEVKEDKARDTNLAARQVNAGSAEQGLPRTTSLAIHLPTGLVQIAGSGRNRRRGGQVRFTAKQTRQLEKWFSRHKYITPSQRKTIAKELTLHEKQVMTWFQNKRAKSKKRAATCEATAATPPTHTYTNTTAPRTPPTPPTPPTLSVRRHHGNTEDQCYNND